MLAALEKQGQALLKPRGGVLNDIATRFDEHNYRIEGPILSAVLWANVLLTGYNFWYVHEFHDMITCAAGGYADYFAQNCFTGLVSLGLISVWWWELLLEQFWDSRTSTRVTIQQKAVRSSIHNLVIWWCIFAAIIYLVTAYWGYNISTSSPQHAYTAVAVLNFIVALPLLGERLYRSFW